MGLSNGIPEEGRPFWVFDLRDELPWHRTKRWKQRGLSAVDRIIVHHTATEVGESQTVREHIQAINRGHIRNNNWPRIAYHVLIGEQGVFWMANDVIDITYHAADNNGDSVGVCLIGDMTQRVPSPNQLQALRWLREAWDLPAVGHKEINATACPGPWWDEWADWVNGADAPEPPPEEPEIPDVRVYDQNGDERSWTWLVENYGPLQVERSPAGTAFRLVALREKEGPASVVVTLYNTDALPFAGSNVIWHWEGADVLPQWQGLPERWRDRGVVGQTNQNGDVGFGMGGGAYYFVPNIGPHAVWVGWPGVGSDFVNGLGMLGGTNHKHVEPVFQLLEGPATGPGPGDVEQHLAAIEAAVAALRGLLS